MKTTKKILGLFLALAMLCPMLVINTVPASAVTPLPIVIQNDYKWTGAANTYGYGTLRDTGCGIFSLVNCVGYLTGKAMDVNEVAAWAYSIGAYNAGGADGTYRYELYPYVEARYGKKYGFTMNCNGTQGWWQGAGSSVLINHLKSGGVAIGHVPGHFIAIVGYNANSTYAYHLYDSYPTTSRGTGNGDCWVSLSHLSNGGALHLDWFCLMSPAQTAPEIKSVDSVNYNTAVSVSWDAINGATSYAYTAQLYNGEPSAVAAASTIVSSTTTGTSFSVPGQASGKYIKLTVTAKSADGNTDSTKLIRLGAAATYPTLTEYVPVNDINGSESVSNSTIWTSSIGKSFGMTWWRAFMCSPNADGTYTVNTIYENGVARTVSVTGKNILFAMHSGYAGYDSCKGIVVGDKLTLKGIYLDSGVVNGDGHILVNGGRSLAVSAPVLSAPTEIKYGQTATVSWGACTNATLYNYKVTNGTLVVAQATGATARSFTIPEQVGGTSLTVEVTATSDLDSATTTVVIPLVSPAPTEITTNDPTIEKDETNKAFIGFDENTTVADTVKKFKQDKEFIVIKDAAGNAVADSDRVATGFTVNIVADGKTTLSYALVVSGDINGDAGISSADYIMQKKIIIGTTSVEGAYALAVDYNGDKVDSAADYIALRARIAGK